MGVFWTTVRVTKGKERTSSELDMEPMHPEKAMERQADQLVSTGSAHGRGRDAFFTQTGHPFCLQRSEELVPPGGMGNGAAVVATFAGVCLGNRKVLARNAKQKRSGQKATTQQEDPADKPRGRLRKRGEEIAATRGGKQVAHGESGGDGSGTQKIPLILEKSEK